MSEPEAKPEDKLESLLRQWGAQQAIGESSAGGVPPMPVRSSGMRVFVRWAPLAGAAAMLAVAVGLFWMSAERERGRMDSRQVAAGTSQPGSAPSDEIRKVESEYQQKIAQKDQQIERMLADLAEAQKARQDLESRLNDKDKELTKARELLAGANTALEGLRKQYDAQGLALNASRQDSVGAKTELKTAQAKLSSVLEELSRARKATEEAQAAQRKAQTDLAAVRMQQDAVMGDIQLVFIYSGGANRQRLGTQIGISLEARQEACRFNRMLPRCMGVAPMARSPQSRRLIARLEVALTKLEMLRPYDPADARSLGKLLGGGELLKELDAVLASGAEDLPVRVWLVEAKLILLGADRVV